MESSVSIQGAGAITCAGSDVSSLWNSVLSGQSRIVNGLGEVSTDSLQTAVSKLSTDSWIASEAESLIAQLPKTKLVLMSLLAMDQAMQQANWHELGPEDGLIFATTTGLLSCWEKDFICYLQKQMNEQTCAQSFFYEPLGASLSWLQKAVRHTGPSLLLSSACSASTQALLIGAHWINQKKVKRCLVGAAEILCHLTKQGFECFQLLSLEPAKPFDRGHQGINLSEGSAFVCLEAREKEKSLAWIKGGGVCSDAYHMTAPHPKGLGMVKAIQQALKSSNLETSDISWVHAHGTGSIHNDWAEAYAMQEVFGLHQPYLSSTKHVHGHALAASGIVETIICLQAMKHSIIPATAGLVEPHAQMNLCHVKTNTPFPLKNVLKNSLGFGGMNASIVIGAHA